MKIPNMVKNHFKNLKNYIKQRLQKQKLQFLEATVNLAPNGVLCIFANQCIMERYLSGSVILRSYFLQYLMLVSISFSLHFCICVYVDVELLVLFCKTSTGPLSTGFVCSGFSICLSSFILSLTLNNTFYFPWFKI